MISAPHLAVTHTHTSSSLLPTPPPHTHTSTPLINSQAAIARAVAEDPSLLAQYPELQSTADRAQALEEKERGNAAFTAGKHDVAIEHYSTAIRLDPTYVWGCVGCVVVWVEVCMYRFQYPMMYIVVSTLSMHYY